MALTQIDLSDDYTEALEYIAKANKTSRRAYAAECLEEALDAVPGLMDMIRMRKVSGVGLNVTMVLPQEKEILVEVPEEEHLYRFAYLDPERGFIEGKGTSAGRALANALGLPEGKFYDPVKYDEEFRRPQRMD